MLSRATRTGEEGDHRHDRHVSSLTSGTESAPYCGRVATDRDEAYGRRASAAPKMADSVAAQLVAQAQDGDRAARAELMASHRRIVARVSERCAKTGLSREERIRVGEQGLEAAIEKFKPAKGFPFSVYATWWVRHAITKGTGGGGAAVRAPIGPTPSAGSGSVAHPVRASQETETLRLASSRW